MIDNFDIAKRLLKENGEIIGITSGSSMKPLFRSGKDKAVIVPLTQTPQVNDVLLYRKKTTEDVVLHRIIKITEKGPILRGDNLFYNETDIPQENLVGIMQGFYRSGKYYDCQKSLGYKLYICYIRLSYPMRYCFHKIISFLKRLKKLLGN